MSQMTCSRSSYDANKQISPSWKFITEYQ